jgi:hypothetical protein
MQNVKNCNYTISRRQPALLQLGNSTTAYNSCQSLCLKAYHRPHPLIRIVTCVRFPWWRDVGALSRNNGIVQHCCISLATQQLKRRAYQQAAWLCAQQ